jgi:hypothetical protein
MVFIKTKCRTNHYYFYNIMYLIQIFYQILPTDKLFIVENDSTNLYDYNHLLKNICFIILILLLEI